VTTSSGRDITEFVSGTGGYHWGSPGDTLLVQMTAPRAGGTFGATETQDGGGGEGGLEGDPKEMDVVYTDFRTRPARPMNASLVDTSVISSTGILIEVPDGTGGWRTLTHYYPRRYRDETVVDSLGSGPCRLIFVGQHRLHFIGRYVRSASPPAPQVLDLLAAHHSRLGDAKAAVRQGGGTVTTLVPGDTLALEFATPAFPIGQVRDYFLLSTGVYSAAAPLAQGQRGDSETSARPTRFALAQNQPNPFSLVTDIRFELPVPTTVRLEVFDLLGRRIATLANGSFPAGFHTVSWDRRDATGARVKPGIYLYRLEAGSFRAQKKLTILP
jgi:flagellar hook capping protein FlgD